jgi:alpha-amylase
MEATQGKISLFDATLQDNFHKASRKGRDYNLAGIFDKALVAETPSLAVTLVTNHDTQPLQALEAPVDPWFKPLAYALVLLREKGYPCVFYPDLYGAQYRDKGRDGNEHEIWMPQVEGLDKLITCRKLFAYGLQRDYLDHANCIGWTREGNEEIASSGCAVLLCNGEEGRKNMEMGKRNAGRKYRDYLGKRTEEVIINEEGWGEFYCEEGSVSVWVAKQ